MRHRCSPWNRIPYQRGGWEGWEVVKDTAELQDKRLNATFHFDRTLLLINMRTPAGVLEQSPENSGHPGDVSLLWVPGLFFPNSPFISIYFERLVKKSCNTLKTNMTCSCIIGIIRRALFVVHHPLWSFRLDLVFKHMLMNVEKLERCNAATDFSAWLLMNLYLGFAC